VDNFGETHCAGVDAESQRPVTAPVRRRLMTGLVLADFAFIVQRR
jgi:hypothetical protein